MESYSFERIGIFNLRY